jgi:hypothetical protein
MSRLGSTGSGAFQSGSAARGGALKLTARIGKTRNGSQRRLFTGVLLETIRRVRHGV